MAQKCVHVKQPPTTFWRREGRKWLVGKIWCSLQQTMLVTFKGDYRGTICFKKLDNNNNPFATYTQILLHAPCEMLWKPEGAWQSPVIQELSAARWHLSPVRMDPLGQLSTSTVYIPKQQRAPPEGWVVSSLGDHMLFRLVSLSHSWTFGATAAAWLFFFFLLILEQGTPYYLNCIILYMPIDLLALKPTTVSFSQYTTV